MLEIDAIDPDAVNGTGATRIKVTFTEDVSALITAGDALVMQNSADKDPDD